MTTVLTLKGSLVATECSINNQSFKKDSLCPHLQTFYPCMATNIHCHVTHMGKVSY